MQPIAETLRSAFGLHQQGNLTEAEELYNKVLKLNPNHFDALHLLGLVLHQQGDSVAGLDRIAAALKVNPNSAEALSNYGSVLSALKRHEEALAYYNRALAIQPRHANALNSLGNALAELGKHEEALACFDKALAQNPNDAKALNNRGNTLGELGNHEEALACFDKALAQNPNNTEALTQRGRMLRNLGRHEEALACQQRGLALKPDDVAALNHCGRQLLLLNRLEEAMACFERARTLNPEDAKTLHSLGNALVVANRRQEALAFFEQSLALQPDNVQCHCHLGQALLSASDFARGWKEYEWRLKNKNHLSNRGDFLQPRWQGEYVQGSLLAWGEQGLGDEILYSSMIPDLRAHAESVVLQVEPRLVKLFARSFPDVHVIGRGEEAAGEIKAQSSLASLGQYLRPSRESFPQHGRGYLSADSEKAAALRRRLSPKGEVVVGLSWISKRAAVGQFKSAQLQDFQPVLQWPGCRFVDLQYGDTRTEREALRDMSGLLIERIEDIDNTNDLDGLAALIRACDMVVSVSNTTAHLAGALGRPTIVLAPFGLARLWYWFHGKRSPWYPDARVTHQARGQSWAETIASCAGEISALVEAARARSSIEKGLS